MGTVDKWMATISDIEGELGALKTLKETLPTAAQAIADIINDPDASARLRFDAAKYVIDRGLTKEQDEDTWKGLTEAIRADVVDANASLSEANIQYTSNDPGVDVAYIDDPDFDGDV
jgi:hypothetical protein